ncbi:MAG TPA: MgtC/SapB family protein [Sedimentisphaerales bacterium]|nr:MgtC/SapB family protein [Sedimentisphaerales bacterium]
MNWPGDVFSIVLAVVLGAAIGIEREFSGKAAGLRTNILICLGAAAFTIISKRMAGENDSITRIAAQIVTGVGFLGAGAIIQDRAGVHGLTTAATIWFVASLGTACGAGFYELAVIMTLLAVFVLIGLRQVQRPLRRYVQKHQSEDVSNE